MPKLKCKKFLIIAVLIIALAAGGLWQLAPTAGPTADLLAARATQNLLALDSLTFHTETTLLLNGETVPLGKIDGEICGANLHVWGNVLGSDMNIYQIGDVTYRQDTLTEQWLITDDKELLNNAALLTDADPRSFFSLTQMADITEVESAEIGGEKCRGVSFVPSTASGYIEQYFDTVSCTVWITRDEQLARARVCASANAAGQSSTLTLTCDFSAWDDTPDIAAPIVQPAS